MTRFCTSWAEMLTFTQEKLGGGSPNKAKTNKQTKTIASKVESLHAQPIKLLNDDLFI